MIGLDTNVLVRYLTQDDPAQSRRVNALIEHELTEAEPGFINVVTFAETVWVLESVYRFADDVIVAAVERMLQADVFVVESEREVVIALEAVRDRRGTFGDALIGTLGLKAGCTHTVTFDRGALRLDGFVAL
jgi:predicted nucleic-acid-binding protein